VFFFFLFISRFYLHVTGEGYDFLKKKCFFFYFLFTLLLFYFSFLNTSLVGLGKICRDHGRIIFFPLLSSVSSFLSSFFFFSWYLLAVVS